MAEHGSDNYPAWRFHTTGEQRLVETPEADADLGEGWYASPVLAQEALEGPKTEAPKTPDKPQEPSRGSRR